MTTRTPKSGSKRPRAGSKGKPQAGIAGPGAPIDPMSIAEDDAAKEAARREPRAAPAPGIPVSGKRYEWLKKKAKAVRTPPSKHGQEDPSEK